MKERNKKWNSKSRVNFKSEIWWIFCYSLFGLFEESLIDLLVLWMNVYLLLLEMKGLDFWWIG